MIKNTCSDRINILSILCLFFLTHFIYVDFSISQPIALFIMLVVCAINILCNKGILCVHWSKLIILFIGSVMLIFFSLPNSRKAYDTMLFVPAIVMGMILIAMEPSDNQIFKSFKLIKIGSALIAVYVIFCKIFPDLYLNVIIPHLSIEVQTRGRSLVESGRYGVPLGGSIVFADYVFSLSLFIILADYLVNRWDFKKKIENFILIILLIVAIFFEGRRGEAITAFITIAIQAFCTLHTRRKCDFSKILKSIIVLTIVLIVIIFILVLNGAVDRFILLYEGLSNNAKGISTDITTGRTVLWDFASDQFILNPIIGIGWGNYEYKSNEMVLDFAHNNYLQILCETGVIGFALITFPIVFIFIKTKQLLHKIKLDTTSNEIKIFCSISFAIQTYFLILNFVDPSFYKVIFWVMYTISISLYAVAKNDINEIR